MVHEWRVARSGRPDNVRGEGAGHQQKEKLKRVRWHQIVRPTLCAEGAQRMGHPQVNLLSGMTKIEERPASEGGLYKSGRTQEHRLKPVLLGANGDNPSCGVCQS